MLSLLFVIVTPLTGVRWQCCGLCKYDWVTMCTSWRGSQTHVSIVSSAQAVALARPWRVMRRMLPRPCCGKWRGSNPVRATLACVGLLRCFVFCRLSDHGTMGGGDAGSFSSFRVEPMKSEALRSMSVELSNIVVGDIPFYRLWGRECNNFLGPARPALGCCFPVREVWCLFRDSRVWQVSVSCPACSLRLHEAGLIFACAPIS